MKYVHTYLVLHIITNINVLTYTYVHTYVCTPKSSYWAHSTCMYLATCTVVGHALSGFTSEPTLAK